MPLSNFTLSPLHVYDFQTTLIGIGRIAAEAQRDLFFGSLAVPTEDHSPWYRWLTGIDVLLCTHLESSVLCI